MLLGLLFALSPIATLLSNKFGIRATCTFGSMLAFIGMLSSSFTTNIYQFLLTFGVVQGTGLSMAFSPSLVLLTKHFNKKLGLANAIVSLVGGCLFTTLTPFYLELLVGITSFRNALRIISIFPFAMILISAIFYVTPAQATFIKRNRFFNRDLLEKSYVLWVIAVAIADYGFGILYTYIIKYYNSATGSVKSTFIVSVLAISAALGRLIFGALSDHRLISRLRLQQAAFVVFGCTYLVAPLLKHPVLVVIATVSFGLTNGANMVLLTPVCFELTGRLNVSQGLGIAFMCKAIFIVIGPPTAGKLFDINKSLSIPFYIAGFSAIIASFIMWFCSTKPQAEIIGNSKREDVQQVQIVLETPTPPSSAENDDELRSSIFDNV